jgi:hypothetical protein
MLRDRGLIDRCLSALQPVATVAMHVSRGVGSLFSRQDSL